MGRITAAQTARRKVLLEQGLKECPKCSIVKSVDEFTLNHKNTSDGLYSLCKECKYAEPAYIEARDRSNKRNYKKFQEYKKTLECELCGYDEDPAKLHFHHRDQATKLFDIAHSAAAGFSERILKEIAKCDVLCTWCHGKTTWIENKYK